MIFLTLTIKIMIIDMHCHTGIFEKKNLTKMFINSMKKYNIDFALFSNVEAVEYTDKQVLLENQKDSISINKKSIYLCKKYPNIGTLLWLKPATEKVDEKLKKFIIKNRQYIYGLKFHPFYSNLRFDDPKYEPYIELAKEFSLPILIHTAVEDSSKALAVYNMAKKYPDVNFIMAHLELITDNLEAIKYIKELPNLYGDTAWVSPEKVVYAIKECGPDKIMFGTDNPIDGVDTYLKYQAFFNDIKEHLKFNEYENLMFNNAKRVFKIIL